METPSFFLSNNTQKKHFSNQFELIEFKSISLAFKKQDRTNYYINDTSTSLVFAHVNIGCKSRLIELGNKVESEGIDFKSIVNHFHWGFILFIDKQTEQISLFNDIYGIYPIYYSSNKNDFIISNDYDELLKLQSNVSLDKKGLYDYLLFNYTLNSRTLFKNIFQLKGGSVIKGYNNQITIEVNKKANISDLLSQKTANRFEIDSLNQSLSKHVIENIDSNLPVELTLSGGFDSKLILSVLLNKQIDFSSFTYGLNGSVDHFAAQETARQLKFSHRLIELKPISIEELDEQIKSFIKCTPGLPLILDLLSYELIKENVSGSNIITGFMGGELINGPVIVSEVMLTRSAKSLTDAKNLSSLKTSLTNDILSNPFISVENYTKNAEEHILGLENYIYNSADENHNNVVNYLLNETYAKFFGVVFKNLFGKYNLINPFMDLGFLSTLLNSKYRFTQFDPYSKNPINHIRSRRLYPKMINRLHEPVIYTPLDRNYVMADLLYLHRLPITLTRYFENHILNKNKIKPSKTNGSINRLKPLIKEKLDNSPILDFDFIEKRKVKEVIEKLNSEDNVPDHAMRKLILLLSIHYLHEMYRFNY